MRNWTEDLEIVDRIKELFVAFPEDFDPNYIVPDKVNSTRRYDGRFEGIDSSHYILYKQAAAEWLLRQAQVSFEFAFDLFLFAVHLDSSLR